MLPQSPDMVRFVTCDLAVNSLTTLGTGVTNLSSGTVAFRTPTVSGSGATVTLTAAQSGSVIAFDLATGIVFTLPAPVAGLNFTFITPVTVTSNSYKIITNVGTVFLVGAVSYGILDTTPGAAPGPKFTAANGSSHVAITMNGSTTGGLQGTELFLSCYSATLWHISGQVIASGTIATPFATS